MLNLTVWKFPRKKMFIKLDFIDKLVGLAFLPTVPGYLHYFGSLTDEKAYKNSY